MGGGGGGLGMGRAVGVGRACPTLSPVVLGIVEPGTLPGRAKGSSRRLHAACGGAGGG